MNIHYRNTYTVSDSDDSVIIKNRQETTSHINERLSSPEEPDFFRQVMQSQKRKILSPEINVHPKKDTCFTQESVYNKKPNIKMCIENPELNICELIEPKRKKRLTKEEREEKKNQEKVQKDAKKKLTEKLKRLNPKECMKYMTVHIDINLQNRDYGKQILSEIQNTNAKYKIELNSSVSHSITWSRQISDIVSEDENFMLLIWDFDYATSLIISNQLLEKINQLKLYKAQLTLIIYTTSDQNKNKKFKKNGFSFSDILNSLNQMMLSCQVSFRFIDNTNEIGLAVLYFTKSIAQKPYKLNKYEEEQEGCDWYATGHTKNCVTVDKNGTGLTQLWRQMLLQFPLCALETSEAITSVYDSPIALLEAYDNCSTRLEGEILLQDIPVRRGYGPLASNRRIGPELSKKIYTFFTDNTGFATLSQE